MIDAIAGLIDAGRVKVYCVDSWDSGSWHDEWLPLEERGRRHGAYEGWLLDHVAPFYLRGLRRLPGEHLDRRFIRRLPRANLTLRRADLFPLAICMSGIYDVRTIGWGEAGDAVYFNNPAAYVANLGGAHLDWLRSRVELLLVVGRGAWEDSTGALGETASLRVVARREGDSARARRVGPRRAARLAGLARADRPSPAAVRLSTRSLECSREDRHPGRIGSGSVRSCGAR